MKHLIKIAIASLAIGASTASAEPLERLHFLIGQSPGGGWDQTARAVGTTMQEAGLVNSATFENIPGGAGAKAVSRLIETATRQESTLLVTSTPVIIYGLQGALSYSWRDLVPVAAVIGDYEALVVKSDHPFQSAEDLFSALKSDVRSVSVGGGSVLGSMDHLVAALAYKSADLDPNAMRYIPYEGGGKAMAALLSGEIDVLSTGLGEALEQQRQGQVRILASTADKTIQDVPTFQGLGYNVEFVNWRGFFAAPGTSDETVNSEADMLKLMMESEQWPEVRDRNGWIDLYYGTNNFKTFLEEQEEQVRALMTELNIPVKN